MWRVCLSFCPFAFLLLLLCLPSFMLVVLLCSGCLSLFSCIVFVALWVWLLFPFPFRTTRKKKGRKGLSLASSLVLLCACFIWLLLCIPRTRQVSARLYRNKVLEKGNLIECSKLFCALRCSCLYSSKFVFLLFPYLFLLVGSCFLSPLGAISCVLSWCVVGVFACRSYSVALLHCFSVILPDLQAQSIKSTHAQRISVE